MLIKIALLTSKEKVEPWTLAIMLQGNPDTKYLNVVKSLKFLNLMFIKIALLTSIALKGPAPGPSAKPLEQPLKFVKKSNNKVRR